MSNGTGALIRRAYMPYVRAFLQNPQDALLRYSNTPQRVRATVFISSPDFARFDSDVVLRSEQARTFNNLVREHDNRPSALRFQPRPQQMSPSQPW